MKKQLLLSVVLALPVVVAASDGLSVQNGSGDYRAVRVGELSRHVGKQVRISLPRGIVREGMLAEANPSTITVERSYGRGGMKFEILSKQIEKVEVQD